MNTTQRKLQNADMARWEEASSYFSRMIKTAIEYSKVFEEESTKRHVQTSLKETRIEQIRAQRDCFLSFIEETYDERRFIFQKMFDILDSAIETNDSQEFGQSLDKIVELAKTSPLDNFVNFKQFKGFIKEPDSEFEF